MQVDSAPAVLGERNARMQCRLLQRKRGSKTIPRCASAGRRPEGASGKPFWRQVQRFRTGIPAAKCIPPMTIPNSLVLGLDWAGGSNPSPTNYTCADAIVGATGDFTWKLDPEANKPLCGPFGVYTYGTPKGTIPETYSAILTACRCKPCCLPTYLPGALNFYLIAGNYNWEIEHCNRSGPQC